MEGGRRRHRRHRRNLSEVEEKNFCQKFKIPLVFMASFASVLLAVYYYQYTVG